MKLMGLGTLTLTSHSAWSAWIEIALPSYEKKEVKVSHSAWSAWIEIMILPNRNPIRYGRTPHGVRGLK